MSIIFNHFHLNDLFSRLHLDAHGDIYEDFEGKFYSHASPFARIMERGLVKKLFTIGVRGIPNHHRDQMKKYGVECVEMRHYTPSLPFVFDTPLYLSIDIDAIDPAHAPGVSHWEPGGFTSREVS